MTFQFWIPILAAVLLIAAYFAYRGTTPYVSGRLRVALTALRLSVFLCLVLIILDPRCVRTSDQQEDAKVVALVDRSASMSLSAGAWGETTTGSRFDRTRSQLDLLEQAVDEAGGSLETVYFSNGLMSTPADSILPDGQGTDIVRTLHETARRYEGEHLVATVLFSDGIETEKRLVRRSLPAMPVFTVGLGDTTAPDDVRITEVDYNSVVRVPSRSPVKATVGYTGLREKRAVLTLTENGRVLFEKELKLSPTQNEIE